MKKKILPLLLAVCLTVGMIPATVFAEGVEVAEEEEEEADPEEDNEEEEAEAEAEEVTEEEEAEEEAEETINAETIAAIEELIDDLPTEKEMKAMSIAELAEVNEAMSDIYDMIYDVMDDDTAEELVSNIYDLYDKSDLLNSLIVNSTSLDENIDVNNDYSSSITVTDTSLSDGLATIKVSYGSSTNTMAGIGYTYTLDGEAIEGRAIAQQIDDDDNPQTDKTNVTGFTRDCTIYTFSVDDDAEDITVTIDGCTTWSYEDGILTISGSGKMADFTYYTIDNTQTEVNERGIMTFPWAEYQRNITKVVIEDGITYIGTQAFRKCINMTDFVVESDNLTEIGITLCMNDTFLTTIDLSICEQLETVGQNAFTSIGSGSLIKAYQPVAGLWRNN